ncbi:MAG: 50S ribosomal protein L9 [Actinomycetota bacterium]|nr:50S ribosomal protein L9 [Actinomycetota bacterium]
MKLILTQEVRSLGAPGDVVEVADGYGRNFLIPRGLARPATQGALKQVETIRKTRELREIADRDKADELANQLQSLKIRIIAKAGDSGRLFGQVTPAAVTEAITKAGGPKVDKRRLHFDGPIKSLGAHQVSLRIHPEVEATLNVEIVKG